MAHIDARGVTIEFPLYHVGARSLKKRILARSPLRFREDESSRVVVQAIRDLNFRIDGGERVALTGPNGAGKTTLLRTLGGIYTPVAGRLEVAGEIGVLLDAGAGFDTESTGRENIRLRGLYQGLDAAAIRRLIDDVAEFSGLGAFLDVPIRTYSAGMSVRLAFAIATASQPAVLLMDEWFLAGDAEFLERAQGRLERLVVGAEILILATHDLGIVRRWCNRVIRIEAGQIVADGSVDAVLGPEGVAA